MATGYGIQHPLVWGGACGRSPARHLPHHDPRGVGAARSVYRYDVEAFDVSVPPELVTLTTPADQAEYAWGPQRLADYSCQMADQVSCVGSVPDGSPIDTSTSGPQLPGRRDRLGQHHRGGDAPYRWSNPRPNPRSGHLAGGGHLARCRARRPRPTSAAPTTWRLGPSRPASAPSPTAPACPPGPTAPPSVLGDRHRRRRQHPDGRPALRRDPAPRRADRRHGRPRRPAVTCTRRPPRRRRRSRRTSPVAAGARST